MNTSNKATFSEEGEGGRSSFDKYALQVITVVMTEVCRALQWLLRTSPFSARLAVPSHVGYAHISVERLTAAGMFP